MKTKPKKQKSLQITTEAVIRAASKCTTAKATLTELFPEVFAPKPDPKQPKPVTERIKTLQDAIRSLPKNDEDIKTYNALKRAKITGPNLHFTELCIIAKALNEGWAPNYSDSNEYKYYPYFFWNNVGAGFVFTHSSYYYTFTYTYVSPRLVFKTRELAEYAGKQFEKIYNRFLSLPSPRP